MDDSVRAAAIDPAAPRWHAAQMERHSQMVNARTNLAVPTAGRRGRLRRALLAAAGMLGLGACAYLPTLPSLPRAADIFETPRQVRGNMVDNEELAQLTVGVSSRDDVQAVLGSPTTTGTFEENEWFYIGAITRQRPARVAAIEEQRTVVVRFNPAGIVQEIRVLGPEDARDVRVVQRVTPTPGTERSFLQQLFGNVGRIGPGLGAQQQGTGPGAATPR